jgi:phosphoribosylglycinamide formyltransferase-1
MTARKRVAILISGRGSNMDALIAACATPGYPAEIATIISNRPDAAGLERARAMGIPAAAIDHKQFKSRAGFEAEMDRALHGAGVDMICSAGFMRLLTADFVERWRDRQLNIHPSLLPSFRGLHAHEQAIAGGVRISGCTVHFMRAEMDTGPIVAQAAVPVLPGDDAETLGARVLAAEHQLYPHALRLVASGEAFVEGESVRFRSGISGSAPLFCPTPG